MKKRLNEIYFEDCGEDDKYRDLVMIAEMESEAENDRLQRIKNIKINGDHDKRGKENKRNKNYRNFRRNSKNSR